MTDELRLLPRDVTKAGMCIAGARDLARLHGLDFKEFMTVGIPLDVARALNDPLVDRACDQAEVRLDVEGAADGQQ